MPKPRQLPIIMRRQRLLFPLLLGLLWLTGCRSPDTPKHVFLVTIDTLRADHLGHMGYPREVSPFLDGLAESGVVFDHAVASSSTTVACHASLFTSLQPPQHQMIRNGVDMHPSLVTMAEMMRQSGFRTAAFSTVGFMTSLARGFDIFDTERKYRSADHVIGKAIDWLELQDPRQPVFLWLHVFDVHQWFKPSDVKPEDLERAKVLAPSGDQLLRLLVDERKMSPRGHGGERQLLDAIDRYDAQILAVDDALEHFHQTTEQLGFGQDALWVITADHGEGLGSHDFLGHGARIYQEQIHVPLIFHDSRGRFGGHRVNRLVRHVDILPTLLDVLDIGEQPQVFPITGHSLAPLLEDASGEFPARYAFSQRREADTARRQKEWEPGEVLSIRSQDFKYILRTEGEDEFFDLRDDPLELRDLTAEQLETRERMRVFLENNWQSMLDQGLNLGKGELNPEYIEELKALGYL